MGRYSATFRGTNAPSATLPGGSLYAATGVAPKLRECHVVNTTNAAVEVVLVRLTTSGTAADIANAEAEFDPDTVANSCQAKDSHSVGPTLGDRIVSTMLAAAVGAAVYWNFVNEPIRIPSGTGNGVGIITLNGAGQILNYTFIWDE